MNYAIENELGTPAVQRSSAHRISWGGIAGGVIATLALQLLFNLLGLGIGASSINASQGNQPGQGMALGALIWFVVSWVLSLAAGGLTAVLLSPASGKRVSGLQGFLVWALSSIVVIYLLSTAAGNLIGGTASVIGRTASLVGSGAKSSVPGVADIVSRATGVTPQQITSQAGEIASDPKFQQVVADAVQNGSFTQQDRDALIGLLVQRRHMTPEQANQMIDSWQTQLTNAAQAAKTSVLKAEDSAASGVSAAAFGSFVSLLLGMAAAVAGGLFGSSQRFRRV